MTIIHWPIKLKFGDGTEKDLPTGADISEWLRDEWLDHWLVKPGNSTHQNELVLQVPYLGELLARFNAIKRAFAIFGITPEIEVDGVSLLEFAWRKQVQEIHYLGLISQARKDLRRGHYDDTKAAIRVALRDGINKPFAEIEQDLIAEAKGVR